jgi:hypothetical protein
MIEQGRECHVVNTASAAGHIASAIGVALQFISVCSVIAGFSKSRVLSDGISA